MRALRNRYATTRAAVIAATLFTALTMTALPVAAEDPSPTPSNTPTPDVTTSPTEAPSPGSPAPTSPNPSDSTPPGGSPSPSDSTPPPSEEPPGDEPVPVDLAVTVPGSKVTLESAGKRIRIDVDNMGYDTARNVVLTIDVGDLTDEVVVDLPGEDYDCEPAGTIATCYYPDLLPGDIDTFVDVLVTPKSGADLGPVGTMHVSVSSDQPDLDPGNNRADVTVELVGSGPDLVAFADPIGPIPPGSSEELYHGFYNYGDQPISGFKFTVRLPPYASFQEEYDGCETYHDNDNHVITCVASGFSVEPGEGVEIVGIMAKIARNAPGDRVLGRGIFTVNGLDEGAASAAKGSYSGLRKLGAKTAGHDADQGDNSVAFPVLTTDSPADLAIRVAKAEGERGDKVKVRFTVTNHGPADIGGFHLVVKAPTGADITAAASDPKVDCTSSSGDIDPRAADCTYLERLAAGKSVKFTIEFTIKADKVGGGGRATVDYWIDTDPNLKNNTARIVIGPPGSAGGGNGGGGGLPVTGASLVALLGGGMLAVLLGGVLYLVSRRRRTTTETTEDAAA